MISRGVYCWIDWGYLSEAGHSISFLGPIPRQGVEETKAFVVYFCRGV
jgi:hypothetical protein